MKDERTEAEIEVEKIAAEEQAKLDKENEESKSKTEYNEAGDVVLRLKSNSSDSEEEEEEEAKEDEEAEESEAAEVKEAEETEEAKKEAEAIAAKEAEELVLSESIKLEKEKLEKENKSSNNEDNEELSKLKSFLKETGGTVEDYVNLNREYTDDNILIKKYYEAIHKGLDKEDIDLLMEDEFFIDKELDSDKDIRRKEIAKKKVALKAKEFFDEKKEKYYEDVKLTSKLPEEALNAIKFHSEFIDNQKIANEKQSRLSSNFDKVTSDLFDNEFKGFNFKIGDVDYSYEIKDSKSIKDAQSDIVEVFNKYVDPETENLMDAKGYHRALFAARNADQIAEHFYNLGKAEQIKSSEKTSKNINMNARKEGSQVINSRGVKIRVVSEENNSRLKIKRKN